MIALDPTKATKQNFKNDEEKQQLFPQTLFFSEVLYLSPLASGLQPIKLSGVLLAAAAVGLLSVTDLMLSTSSH